MTHSLEWALAMIATTIAEGAPAQRRPAYQEVADAAQWLVDELRAADIPHVFTSQGIWDLRHLEDDEVLALGQALARDLFDRQGVKFVWVGDEGESR